MGSGSAIPGDNHDPARHRLPKAMRKQGRRTILPPALWIAHPGNQEPHGPRSLNQDGLPGSSPRRQGYDPASRLHSTYPGEQRDMTCTRYQSAQIRQSRHPVRVMQRCIGWMVDVSTTQSRPSDGHDWETGTVAAGISLDRSSIEGN